MRSVPVYNNQLAYYRRAELSGGGRAPSTEGRLGQGIAPQKAGVPLHSNEFANKHHMRNEYVTQGCAEGRTYDPAPLRIRNLENTPGKQKVGKLKVRQK